MREREREKSREKTEKLILDKNEKHENSFHYRILKFYVAMGVRK